MTPTDLTHALADLRCRGITQTDVARALGVDTSTISRWKGGTEINRAKTMALQATFQRLRLIADIHERIRYASEEALRRVHTYTVEIS